jgi:membrane protein
VRDFTQGQLSLRAMGLAYTTLLSLVPLLAVIFSVLKGFGVP